MSDKFDDLNACISARVRKCEEVCEKVCEENKKTKENKPNDVSTPKQKDTNLPWGPQDNSINVSRKIFSPPPQFNQTPIIIQDNMDKLLEEEGEEGLEDISKDDFAEENCKPDQEVRNQSFLEMRRANQSKF